MTDQDGPPKAAWRGLREIPLARLAAVGTLFFLTGATGLIYQVLWTRQLTYVFGASLYAVSTTLAAFMGGLALGSWWFGRRVDGWRRPLAAYGVLEILVGLAAFGVRWAVPALDPVFQAMYDNLQSNFLVFSLIRFVLIFAVLLVPTTLMGGTLPILSRYVTRRSGAVGRRVGALYVVNTFGAVAGCFLAGFVLMRLLGLFALLVLAAALNVVVGVVALAMSGQEEGDAADAPTDADSSGADAGAMNMASATQEAESPPIETALYPRWIAQAVLVSYGVSGFVALAYEVLWSRALIFAMGVIKNTTYAFTAMLTVFLIGLAAGGAVASRLADRQRDPLRLYGLIQMLIGLSGAFSFFVIFYLASGLAPFDERALEGGLASWLGPVVNTFCKATAALLAPTFMMGMAFPVAARLYVSGVARVGGDVGRLYAFNTLGAIVGSFLGGFVLIPAMGLAGGLMALAIVNVALGAFFLAVTPRSAPAFRAAAVGVGVVSVIVFLVRFPGADQPFHRVDASRDLVFYEEGPLATVSVVETAGYKRLYVDGIGVAGTHPAMLTDQKSLAHFPTLILPDPHSALTVGFGSGGASHSYCLYDFMTHVRCAEISPTVLRAAPSLVESNHGIIRPDPKRRGRFVVRPDARGRYDVILDDVRSYLRFTEERYDAIATDCTDLNYKSNANLYELGYFTLCGERITDDGAVIVWLPMQRLSREVFHAAVRTFWRAFPEHTSVWYMNNIPNQYVLLVGSPGHLRIDLAKMKRRLADPAIDRDLAEVGLNDPYKILSCYVTDQRGLEAAVGDGPVNTADRPYIEFEAPRSGMDRRPPIENFVRIWEARNDPAPHVVWNGGPLPPGEAETLERYRRAADALIRGHRAFLWSDIETATRAYLEAKRWTPDDASIDALLDYPELRRLARVRPDDLRVLTALGEGLLIQERLSEAREFLRSAVAAIPTGGAEASETLREFADRARRALAECERRVAERP